MINPPATAGVSAASTSCRPPPSVVHRVYYEDLLLHLAADGPDRFAVRVLRSPAGEAAARSQELPAGSGWTGLAEALARQVETDRATRRPGSLRNLEPVAEPALGPRTFRDVEALGGELFATLFPPPSATGSERASARSEAAAAAGCAYGSRWTSTTRW